MVRCPGTSRGEVGLGRFDDETEMVSHQAIRVNLPAGFLAGLAEGGEEAAPVKVVLEDVFEAFAAVHDVVGSPLRIRAELWGMDEGCPGGRVVSIVRTDSTSVHREKSADLRRFTQIFFGGI